MPRSIFLVPGYGAQGGTAAGAAHCFNKDGLGAVVSSSRSITYAFARPDISEDQFDKLVRDQTLQMIKDINAAVGDRTREA